MSEHRRNTFFSEAQCRAILADKRSPDVDFSDAATSYRNMIRSMVRDRNRKLARSSGSTPNTVLPACANFSRGSR